MKAKAIKRLTLGAALALALLAGCGAATGDQMPPAETPAPTPTAPAQTQAPDKEPEITLLLPIDDPAELWSDDTSLHTLRPYLLEIPLDGEAQWDIYRLCNFEDGPFCLLMAIGYHETGGSFDTGAVGDGGGSRGLFQINVKWHTDRMERLGVTDLTDPVQCAAVALDYLQELADRYGFEAETEQVLMAYNMGPGGARKALEAGTTSTAYSREVFAIYQGFLKEMEW